MIQICKTKIMNFNMKSKLKSMKEYLREEKGMGVVEVILIVVVLVGLVFLFKDKMTAIVSNMFTSITDGITKVTN
jgi:Flp pilus assembly pilin Flp